MLKNRFVMWRIKSSLDRTPQLIFSMRKPHSIQTFVQIISFPKGDNVDASHGWSLTCSSVFQPNTTFTNVMYIIFSRLLSLHATILLGTGLWKIVQKDDSFKEQPSGLNSLELSFALLSSINASTADEMITSTVHTASANTWQPMIAFTQFQSDMRTPVMGIQMTRNFFLQYYIHVVCITTMMKLQNIALHATQGDPLLKQLTCDLKFGWNWTRWSKVMPVFKALRTDARSPDARTDGR